MDHTDYLRVARALRREADSTRRLARKLAATTIDGTWRGPTRNTAQSCLDDVVLGLEQAVSRLDSAEADALRRWREEVQRRVQGSQS